MGKFEQAVFAVALEYGHQWAKSVAERGLPLDFSSEGLRRIGEAAAQDCGPVGGVLAPNIEIEENCRERIYLHTTTTGRISLVLWPDGYSIEVRRPAGRCILLANGGAQFGGAGGLPLRRHILAALEVAVPLQPYYPEITGSIDDLYAEMPAAEERERVGH